MRTDLRLRFLWALAGWTLIALVLMLCLLPAQTIAPVAKLLPDKVEHFIAFAGLTAWFCGLYPRSSWWKIAAAFLFFGAAIEVAQGVFTTTRAMEFNDWVADGAGIVVALLLSRFGLANWSCFIETGVLGLSPPG
jgi:VanZ family protein